MLVRPDRGCGDSDADEKHRTDDRAARPGIGALSSA
jgi:hypothetical protein